MRTSAGRVNRALRAKQRKEPEVKSVDWEDTYRGSKGDLMWLPASAFTMMHIRKLFKLIAARGDCTAFLELFGARKDGELPELNNLSERGAETILRIAALYFRGACHEID